MESIIESLVEKGILEKISLMQSLKDRLAPMQKPRDIILELYNKKGRYLSDEWIPPTPEENEYLSLLQSIEEHKNEDRYYVLSRFRLASNFDKTLLEK